MDKVKSLRFALIKYLIPCLILCVIGCALIEWLSIYLQDWYRAENERFYRYDEVTLLIMESNDKPDDLWLYYIFRYARLALIPLWTGLLPVRRSHVLLPQGDQKAC